MSRTAYAVMAVVFLALAGCVPEFMKDSPSQSQAPIAYGPATEKQVEHALQRYSGLIVAMDADALADMYAPDGVWERQSGPLQGRDAIRRAVASASNVHVLSNEMTTLNLSYNGPAIIQTGEFTQSARLADNRIISVSGRFEATWVRSSTGEWWLRRMVTRPNK